MTFNRAAYTRKVFEKIKEAKIKKLYVANDAPREGNVNDKKNRDQIRAMLKEIDWDCELNTLFHENNCGNGFGPVAAINWAFEKEDRLIILEDDCVPSLPFFPFCEFCLDKYEKDLRIWQVVGRSHWGGASFFEDQDYIFSYFGHTLGWATWKNRWKHFDIQMSKWESFCQAGGFYNMFPYNQAKILTERLNVLKKRPINSWDARWGFAIRSNSGLSIVPAKNLIHNIGVFGAHSSGKITRVHKLLAEDDFQVENEPQFIMVNREYETYHFDNHIKTNLGQRSLVRRFLGRTKGFLVKNDILNIK